MQRFATVSRTVRLRMLAAAGTVPVDAELRYSASDPFAVEALFDTGESQWVRWVFARDLLAGGLVGSAGEGDVSVAPAQDEGGRRVVHVQLSSPEGMAVLEAPARAVADFLAATYDLVPAGLEGEHLHIDDTVDALLDH